MNKRTRFITGLGLAGSAAFLAVVLPTTDTPPERAARPQHAIQALALKPSAAMYPQAGNSAAPPLPAEGTPLLPPPVISAGPGTAAPLAFTMPLANSMTRPLEEAMLSSWAARDPDGAGRWLNQNRQHPKFADMVRGYAIQIATIDPAAARQWAAVLKGNGNRFALGGTLEQHIDAVEAMLKKPNTQQAAGDGQLPPPEKAPAPSPPADYVPVLVRQNPGEPPVLEMQPTSPFV